MKTYTDAQKLDLLDRMEKDFTDTKEMKQFEKLGDFCLKLTPVTPYNALKTFIFAILGICLTSAFVKITNIRTAQLDILLDCFLFISILSALGLIILYFPYISLQKKIQYIDPILQDFSDMRNMILKKDEKSDFFNRERENDCSSVIQYFTETYFANHPSETDPFIFAQILKDVSDEFYRLDRQQLEEEKKSRECFIDSFAESIMENKAPRLLD